MLAKKIEFIANWEWTHWVVLIAVLVLTVHQVYKRQMIRVGAEEFSNVKFIEEDIKEYNTQAEKLGQMEVLPPVRNQWDYVIAIADQYGVEVSLVSDKNSKEFYDGPLSSWTADLKGRVGAVLVAAKDIQKTVPVYLYDVMLKDGNANIRFSVLGSD